MHSHIVSKRSKAGRLLVSVVGAGALLSMAGMVQATNGWLSDWQQEYPNSTSDNNASCALCHNAIDTNGSLNDYGNDINDVNSIPGAEGFDSDGEGHTNLEEINADAQPAWTGSAPTGVSGDLDPTVVVENQPPSADPGGAYTGIVGVDVQFDGSGSSDPEDGTNIFYDWDFGDGVTANGVAPAHIYTLEGTYNVTLTVTDMDGATDTASTTASIAAAGENMLPTADANGPYSGTVDFAVAFDGTGSSDPDGSIVSYAWTFGDGGTATGATPSHTYTSTGEFQVTLTVTDDAGGIGSDSTTATIGTGELAPVADASGPYTGTIGNAVTFDGSGSSDADGDIVAYEWSFGDGTTGSGMTTTHTYNTVGTYNVTLTVVDNDGLSDSDSTSASITDPNDVPVVDEGDDEERDDYDRDDYDRDDYDRDDDDRDDDDRDDDDRDDDDRDRDYDRDDD